MTKPNDTNWIDQLIAVGKDLGLDIPGQPPARGRTGTPPAQVAPAADVPQPVTPPATLVAVSQQVPRSELAELFEVLAARLREGSIVLEPGPYAVRLDVPDEVTIDIAARTSEQRERTDLAVDLTIRWVADRVPRSPQVFGTGSHRP